MCHSVEMYMPDLTRQAAAHRIGAADFAAAGHERAAVGLALTLWTRLRELVGRRSAVPAMPREMEEVR